MWGLMVQHEHPGLFPVQEDMAEQCEGAGCMEENFWKCFLSQTQSMSGLLVVQGVNPHPLYSSHSKTWGCIESKQASQQDEWVNMLNLLH